MQANDVGECRSTVPHAACVENVRSGHEADRSRASEVGQLVADSGNTAHHHESLIVARQMIPSTPEAAVRKSGSEEVRCSVN